ncbi:MAG: Ycf66 family protein [Snowella sp.]|nr:Ycf66 family protein [Snowella sp.]
MLAYILAIAIVLASLVFFFSAFFAPKLHRKDDFLWSGVGLFYGLVLWVCAGRITGGVLLGQMAAVVLILSFTWQTISLRGAIANPEKIPNIKTFSLLDWIGGGLSKKKAKVKPTATTPVQPQPEVVTETNEKVETVADAIADRVPLPTQVSFPTEEIEAVAEMPEEEIIESETMIADVEPALKTDEINDAVEDVTVEESPAVAPPSIPTPSKTNETKKPNFLSRFFGKKQPQTKPESITSVLDTMDEDDSDWEERQDKTTAIASEPIDNIVEEKIEPVASPLEDGIEIEASPQNTVSKVEITTEVDPIPVDIEENDKAIMADELDEDWETEGFEETANEYEPTKIETQSFSEKITVATIHDNPDEENNQDVIEIYQIEAAVETISYEQEQDISDNSVNNDEDSPTTESSEDSNEQTPEDTSHPESGEATSEETILEKVADLPNDNPDIHG